MKPVIVRFNGHDPALVDQITAVVGIASDVSVAHPALPDKTLRRVTCLEFSCKSEEERAHIASLLAPIAGVEIVT